MLKYFAKVFLISILSGSLLFLDIGSKGIQLQAALAASGGLGGIADAAAKERAATNAAARASAAKSNSAGSSNAASADHSMTSTVKTGEIDDSNMMATLTMTAVGLLASRLWSCTMTTDMMLAAAGGAIFIGGEALAFFKLKSAMKEMEMQLTRDKKGNINREQIAALERLKQSYEEAKKTASTKKMLQMAAAAAFAAAAVMAYSLSAAETSAIAACKASLPASAAGCVGLEAPAGSTVSLLAALEAGRLIPSPSAAALAKSNSQEIGVKASETSTKVTASSLATSYAATCGTVGGAWACPIASKCQAASPPITAACAPVTPTLKTTTGFCPAAPGLVNMFMPAQKYYAKNYMNPQLKIITLMLSNIISDAHADLFSPLGIASSAAINFLLATSKTLGMQIDMYLLAPMNRAIIWGVLGALTYAASSATDDVISQIESNISKIDSILNSLYSYTAGATANQTSATLQNTLAAAAARNALSMNAAKYEDTDLSSMSDGQLPCSTGPDSKKCKSMDEVASNLSGNNLLDQNSKMQLSSILKTANGFNGTSKISKGSLEGASKMAANAVAYRAAAEKAKKLAQERLKASGSKIDLDAETKKFAGSIDKAMRDGLKKSNSSTAAMFSSMYGGGAGSTSASGSSDSKLADEKADKGATVAAIEPGVVDLNAGAGSMAVDLGAGAVASEENKELSAEELAAYNASTKGATSVDEFEIKNDITKDTTSSIFELISNRYQRSGYQRLFKVKEAAENTDAVSN